MTTNVRTISEMASVGRAAATMEQIGAGCLPVLRDGRIVGILTSRDIRRAHPNRLVMDVMTSDPVTVDQNTPISEACELMQENGIERLLICEGNSLVGILTASTAKEYAARVTDPLTELARPEVLESVVRKFLKEGHQIVAAFFDVDNFGEVNKKFGHKVGDDILREIATKLSSGLDTKYDSMCRYAGDEFALFSSRPLRDVISLAAWKLREISDDPRLRPAGVTLSAGIVTYNPSEHSCDSPSDIIRKLITTSSLASSEAKAGGKQYTLVSQISN